MKHLIVSREYPLAPYPAGGIGAYVANISRLLVDRGDTVHVIGQRWRGAPVAREVSCGGRLVVHRVGEEDLPEGQSGKSATRLMRELEGLKKSAFPDQWFAWHAAFLAEKVIEAEGIDIIEGQDWEAPLYCLLLRRALGLGPQARPPCIIYLHTPTEFVQRFNGFCYTSRQYTVMKRMEDFCIHAADALLCPSEHFARLCREHYRLSPERIKVIKYPVGVTPFIERDIKTWAEGSICYFGRLEPRKGVIEWVDAASRVAREDAKVHFDFVGADVAGLQQALLSRIPKSVQSRFRFHGPKTRAELIPLLARAKSVVVPSRWENFPNVCIEAMSSGLPIIATSLGGMSELVEDERTGWLVQDTGVAGIVDGLANALRRCNSVSADQRAAMGRMAADSVRQRCNNARTVDEQREFRTEVIRRGAQRSLATCELSRGGIEQKQNNVPTQPAPKGAGVVIRVDLLEDAGQALESIYGQTTPARAVAVIYTASPNGNGVWKKKLTDSGMTVVYQATTSSGADSWNAGLKAIQDCAECAFWLFLDQHDYLLPDYLEQVHRVFARRPDVGIISPWTERTIGPVLEAHPCPTPYYQITDNDVSPASAFRAEALFGRPAFRVGMPREYDMWDLANMVMAKGWTAVTLPQILATRSAKKPNIEWPDASALRSIRVGLLSHFSSMLPQAAFDLVESYVPIPMTVPPDSEGQRQGALRFLMTALLDPRRAARAVIRRLRRVGMAAAVKVDAGFRKARSVS